MRDAPASPCRKLCRLEGPICAGCGRSGAEIARWPAAEPSEKHAILQRSAARLAARSAKAEICLDAN